LALSCKTEKTANEEKSNDETSNMEMDFLSFLNNIGDFPFLIEKYASDSTYGYTEMNPIMVGGVNDGKGPENERRFLNSIAGPNGELIEYQRLGSCCPFETKNVSENYYGMLDVYEVTYKGLETPINLFINMYDADTLRIPVGFTRKWN
jgi:hypothetical protein